MALLENSEIDLRKAADSRFFMSEAEVTPVLASLHGNAMFALYSLHELRNHDMWQRATNRISERIAQSMRYSRLGQIMLGGPEFFTDHHKLLGELGKVTIAYYGVATEAEIDAQVRVARDDEWLALVEHIRDVH